MPNSLRIYTGEIVQLTRNIDLTRDLANGSIGTITKIRWKYAQGQIHQRDFPEVTVRFNFTGEEHIINAVSVEFDSLRGYGAMSRLMLPLVPCYAATVHKLQGCTVSKAVVYLGRQMFADGQAYVALTRVESLDGLQIVIGDFSEQCLFKINEEGRRELERMRRDCSYVKKHKEEVETIKAQLDTGKNQD